MSAIEVDDLFGSFALNFEEEPEGAIVWLKLEYSAVAAHEADGMKFNRLFTGGFPIRFDLVEQILAGPDHPVHKLKWVEVDVLTEPPRPLRALGEIEGVVAFDVGQGAMQGLMRRTEDHVVPVCYIDLGGGVLQNTHTFPSAFRQTCFGTRPPVVLSHWDWDHWSSAFRFEGALNSKWFVPPLSQKPLQQAFALILFEANALHIWKPTPGRIFFAGSVTWNLCTGRTTNDSGIAAVVQYGHKLDRLLLPGDAAYMHIPSAAAATSFNSLIMTHHGGRLKSKHVPTAAAGAVAICSVGAGNSYQHPFLDTFEAHAKQGWPLPVLTGSHGSRPGHVYLTSTQPVRGFGGACYTGSGCQSALKVA
jgi:hypothetical protein